MCGGVRGLVRADVRKEDRTWDFSFLKNRDRACGFSTVSEMTLI